MLSFTKNFSTHDVKHFWSPFPHCTTLCRMTFLLRSNNGEEYAIDSHSRATEENHAEINAYNSIKEELFTCLSQQNHLQVLDFIIALNNSPCTDCRRKILSWIREIQQLIPNTAIRLILFFSHLYSNKEHVSSVVEPFAEWIREVVDNQCVVIICPIVVFKMLPEFNYWFEVLIKVIKSDKRIIERFRDLLRQLKLEKHENNFFSLFPSHDFFNRLCSVRLSLFTWENPQYISIVPRDKENLKKLFWKFQLREVAQEISETKGDEILSPQTKEIPEKSISRSNYYWYKHKSSRIFPFYRRIYFRGQQQSKLIRHVSWSKLNELKRNLMSSNKTTFIIN